MQPGRKILNLRCDRKISQQDLAKACDITPSALSKIEAGINSPRANIIWKIARNLGVTVEYLLDEEMPYPYPSQNYQEGELSVDDENARPRVRMDVRPQEKAFLESLRGSHSICREIAYTLPHANVETIRLIHFLLNHSRIKNPSHKFLKNFEFLLTNGDLPGKAETTPAKPRKKIAKKKSSSRR